MTVNEQLLQAIKDRKGHSEPFGCGITTADHYVRTLQECVGSDMCYRYAATRQESFDDILRKSAKTLVYRNQDMVTEKTDKLELLVKEDSKFPSVGIDFKADAIDGIELPKDTLVVFRHVLTTPRKDRDGDVLRTQGAELDPKMLLLWQHVHALPIGKMVGVVEHTAKRLEIVSAIVDMNDLCHDAAVMVENDMARFSHGFRALEFDQLKDDNGNSLNGFDIKQFEIMEASVVSIPSNKDAETTEVILSLVEGGKLTSPLMKEVGKTIREKRPLQVTGVEFNEKDDDGDETKGGCKCGASGEKDGGDSGEEVRPKEDKSQDTEVKAYMGYSYLTGSWEDKQHELSRKLSKYMDGCMDEERCFYYPVATFDDHMIVCREKYEYGCDDEFAYYKVPWAVSENKCSFQGEPTLVEVSVTAEEIAERDEEKAIRCEKFGGVPQPEPELTAQDAAAVFLFKATAEEQKTMLDALKAFAVIREDQQLAEQYKALS